MSHASSTHLNIERRRISTHGKDQRLGIVTVTDDMPGWRNGRRCGLKIRCPKGRAGSTPALGTNFIFKNLLVLSSSTRIEFKVRNGFRPREKFFSLVEVHSRAGLASPKVFFHLRVFEDGRSHLIIWFSSANSLPSP